MELAFRFLPVIFFIATVVLQSQQAIAQGVKQAEAKQPELELIAHVTDHKYCSGSSMLFTLQLEYKNLSKQNLILLKYAVPPFEYRVGKNTEAVRKKRYETVITPMLSPNNGSSQFGDEPPSDYFVTLQPGQSYTPINTIKIPLFIAETDENTSEDSVGAGEHVLQLHISPWPFANDLEEELRTRWQRFGYLWTKDVLSVPMAFQVGKLHDRTLSDCNRTAPPG